MDLASSRIHFPQDKLGTQEREITDQEHIPLFHKQKTDHADLNGCTVSPLTLNIPCVVLALY